MAESDVAVSRRLIEALAAGDSEAALACVSEDVRWCETTRPGLPGLKSEYRGHAGLTEWTAAVEEMWDDVRAEVISYEDFGDGKVLVAYRVHATTTGGEMKLVSPVVFDAHLLRDGKIVERRLFGSREKATVSLRAA
jgi:ketosteroid isomerase-like protein